MATKRDAFEALAVPRTKKALKAIRVIANMGGNSRYRYEFSAEDVEKIATALNAEVDRLRVTMQPPGRQLDVEFDFLDKVAEPVRLTPEPDHANQSKDLSG